MNQGAREANDSARHLGEQAHSEHVRRLLTEIRDLLRWHFRDDPIEKPEAVGAVDPHTEVTTERPRA